MKAADHDASYVLESSVINDEGLENATTDDSTAADSEEGLHTDMALPSCSHANPSEGDQPTNCEAAKFILKTLEGRKLNKPPLLTS